MLFMYKIQDFCLLFYVVKFYSILSQMLFLGFKDWLFSLPTLKRQMLNKFGSKHVFFLGWTHIEINVEKAKKDL